MDMDTSPSKRRKVSATASVAVPTIDAGNPFHARKDEQGTPSISSYMSPTKASLARFNPTLLPAPNPAPSPADESPSRRRKSLSPRRLGVAALESPGRAATASPTRAALRESTVLAGVATPQSPSKNIESRAIFRVARGADPAARPSTNNREPKQSRLGLHGGPGNGRDDAKHGTRKGSRAQSEEAEPELPPTPEQLGLQPRATPPRGLASSSPLKPKAGRQGTASGSSPLKPKGATQNTTQDSFAAGADDDVLPSVADVRQRKREALAQEHERRRKKRSLDQLLKQCQSIRADIDVLQEHVRGGILQDSIEPQVAVQVLDALTSGNPSRRPLPPPSRSSFTSAKLAAFLPFTKARTFRRPQSSQNVKALSYAPINLLDPSAYRTAFTPLGVELTSGFLDLEDDRHTQTQDISLASPKSLLSIKFRATSNVATGKVNAVEVSHVSPWADAELGQWLRQQARAVDVPSMGWACGRYWEVACHRARHWLRCQALFPQFFPTQDGAKQVSDDDTGDAAVQYFEKPISRDALHMNIGRQTLLFSQDKVSLLFGWYIVLDGSGEVTSEVDVSASYPKVWQDTDERGSLKKLKEAFRKVQERGGILEATRVLVQVVFPT